MESQLEVCHEHWEGWKEISPASSYPMLATNGYSCNHSYSPSNLQKWSEVFQPSDGRCRNKRSIHYCFHDYLEHLIGKCEKELVLSKSSQLNRSTSLKIPPSLRYSSNLPCNILAVSDRWKQQGVLEAILESKASTAVSTAVSSKPYGFNMVLLSSEKQHLHPTKGSISSKGEREDTENKMIFVTFLK